MLNRLNDDPRITIQPIELFDERRLIFHRQPHRADGVIVAIDRRFTGDRCSIATAHDSRGGIGRKAVLDGKHLAASPTASPRGDSIGLTAIHRRRMGEPESFVDAIVDRQARLIAS